MEIATIKRGESFTFKVVLNAEYDSGSINVVPLMEYSAGALSINYKAYWNSYNLEQPIQQ